MPEVQINEGEQPVIHKCGVCGKAWDTMKEYEDHCKENATDHMQFGHSPCLYCGKKVDFTTLPFSKELEITPTVCDECFAKIVKPALIASGQIKEGQ